MYASIVFDMLMIGAIPWYTWYMSAKSSVTATKKSIDVYRQVLAMLVNDCYIVSFSDAQARAGVSRKWYQTHIDDDGCREIDDEIQVQLEKNRMRIYDIGMRDLITHSEKDVAASIALLRIASPDLRYRLSTRTDMRDAPSPPTTQNTLIVTHEDIVRKLKETQKNDATS